MENLSSGKSKTISAAQQLILIVPCVVPLGHHEGGCGRSTFGTEVQRGVKTGAGVLSCRPRTTPGFLGTTPSTLGIFPWYPVYCP